MSGRNGAKSGRVSARPDRYSSGKSRSSSGKSPDIRTVNARQLYESGSAKGSTSGKNGSSGASSRLVYGYVRVSTAEQVTEGISLDAQRERIAAWATSKGLELGGIFCDAGISGKRADNRPQLQRALETVCNERAILVFHSLSRLARSTRDTIAIAERLRAAGADLVSLTEDLNTATATGELIFTVLAALSQFERQQIGERTSTALRHRMKNGGWVGKVPFGYDLDTSGDGLVKNPMEQKVIRLMRRLRKQGMSYRKIADQVKATGIPPKTGKEWHASTVMLILDRR